MSRSDVERRLLKSWKANRPPRTVLPPSQFLLFLFSGGLNTLFGYAMFLLSLKAGLSLGVALVASTLAGVIFNFQTSRILVFSSRRRGRLFPFAAVYAIALLADYAAILALRHAGLQNWSAQAVMVGPIAVLSFYAQRRFVFPDKVAA